MNKLLCLLLSGLLIASAGRAQSFRYRATVDAVKQSGFHWILLPPGVIGHLNDYLTDVRLYDDQQREVPYRLIRQQPTQTAPFVDYELVSKQSLPNVATTLIVRNRAKSPISSLGIVIKNTNVGKKARLSGSSDAKNWYAIDDDLWLSPTQNEESTTETKRLSFPLSDYEYYRLTINDSLSTPLNIIRVGRYALVASAGAYTAIPGLTVTQRDSSDKRTYVHLTRTDDARFDKLVFRIESNTPFRRRAEVGQFSTRKLKRGRVERSFKVVRAFELSAADSNIVDLPSLKAKDLYVVIANDDNPPLLIRDIRAYQLTTYLLANLTASSPYQLCFSADDVAAPAYDPTPFSVNVPANPPIITVRNIIANPSDDAGTRSFFTDSRIIWPALGLVLLVLGVLSYRMLREMGQSSG